MGKSMGLYSSWGRVGRRLFLQESKRKKILEEKGELLTTLSGKRTSGFRGKKKKEEKGTRNRKRGERALPGRRTLHKRRCLSRGRKEKTPRREVKSRIL